MTTINAAQQMVDAFHEHARLKRRATLSDECPHRDYLIALLRMLRGEADLLMKCLDDPVGYRLHLELEELVEKFQAMLDGDEIAVLDGAADQLYVLLGTAATYDMPLEAAFLEVHRSNMTKEKQPNDPHSERLRSKGPNYRPPDIASILDVHRYGYCTCGCGEIANRCRNWNGG